MPLNVLIGAKETHHKAIALEHAIVDTMHVNVPAPAKLSKLGIGGAQTGVKKRGVPRGWAPKPVQFTARRPWDVFFSAEPRVVAFAQFPGSATSA